MGTKVSDPTLQQGGTYQTQKELQRGAGVLVSLRGLDPNLPGRYVLEFIDPAPGGARQISVGGDTVLLEVDPEALAEVEARRIARLPPGEAEKRIAACEDRAVLMAIAQGSGSHGAGQAAMQRLLSLEGEGGGKREPEPPKATPAPAPEAMPGGAWRDGYSAGASGAPQEPPLLLGELAQDRWNRGWLQARQEMEERRIAEEEARKTQEPKPVVVSLHGKMVTVAPLDRAMEAITSKYQAFNLIEQLRPLNTPEVEAFKAALTAYTREHQEARVEENLEEKEAERQEAARGAEKERKLQQDIAANRLALDLLKEEQQAPGASEEPALKVKVAMPVWLRREQIAVTGEELAALSEMTSNVRGCRKAAKGMEGARGLELLDIAKRYLEAHRDLRPVGTMVDDLLRRRGQIDGTGAGPGRPKAGTRDNQGEPPDRDEDEDGEQADREEEEGHDLPPTDLDGELVRGDVGRLPRDLAIPHTLPDLTTLEVPFQIAMSTTARALELIEVAEPPILQAAKGLETYAEEWIGFPKLKAPGPGFIPLLKALGRKRAEVLAAIDGRLQWWVAEAAKDDSPVAVVVPPVVDAQPEIATAPPAAEPPPLLEEEVQALVEPVPLMPAPSAVPPEAPVEGYPPPVARRRDYPIHELGIVLLPNGQEDLWHRPIGGGTPTFVGKVSDPEFAQLAKVVKDRIAAAPPQPVRPAVPVDQNMRAAQAALSQLAMGLPALAALGLDVSITINTRRPT